MVFNLPTVITSIIFDNNRGVAKYSLICSDKIINLKNYDEFTTNVCIPAHLHSHVFVTQECMKGILSMGPVRRSSGINRCVVKAVLYCKNNIMYIPNNFNGMLNSLKELLLFGIHVDTRGNILSDEMCKFKQKNLQYVL
jgi:hypothetical protein